MIWNRRDVTTWASKHFRAKEFECQCGVCARQVMDDKLIAMLDEVRELVGLPIKVTSGFRCANRQDALRKQGLETTAGKSSHENGMAADLACADMAALEKACLEVFADRSVGIARTFIHVDTRQGVKPRRWRYK